MRKLLTNFLFRLGTQNMSKSAERTFWLILGFAVQYKGLMATLLILGILVGFLEGASLAALALSVFVITSESGDCLGVIQTVTDTIGLDLCGRFEKQHLFLSLLGIGVCLQVGKSVIQYVSSVIGAHLEAKVGSHLQTKVVMQLMLLEYKLVNSYSAGEKQVLLSSATSAVRFLNLINVAIVTVCMFISYFVLLIATNWQWSIFTGFVIFLVLFLIYPLLAKLRKLGKQARKMAIRLSAQTIEYLQALRLVRLYGREKYVSGFIKDTVWEVARLQKESSIWNALIAPSQETVIILTAVFILFVGYITSEDPSNALPQLLAFVVILHRCNGRLSSINALRAMIARQLPQLEHVANFLQKKKKYLVRDTGLKIDKTWHKIELDSVSFKFTVDGPHVLEKVSFTIHRGEKIALVGPSGAGKSTLMDLVSGLYEPTSGTISINGITSSKAKPSSWYELFSVVSQNDLILNLSVKKNLLFANPDASQADIIHACKIADAHEFICQMENGYDSALGERGYRLSGGQIQRLAFARAILKGTSVLILDEATSSLDVLTEERITQALLDLGEDKTILLIAHRMSTVRNADRIIVLDDGAVVDIGSHSELLNSEGLYKEMWETCLFSQE